MVLASVAATALFPLLCLFSIAWGATLMIDDADPRVQYTGSWVPAPSGDPQQQFNYQGTITYSNDSGAVASIQFTGSAVAVYGAFEPVGMFDMRSEYSIDGKAPAVFLPPSEITTVAHRRLFFASGEIPYGPHVLTIENLGEQMWFDYIQVEVPGDDGTTSAQAVPPASDTGWAGGDGSSTTSLLNPPSTSLGGTTSSIALAGGDTASDRQAVSTEADGKISSSPQPTLSTYTVSISEATVASAHTAVTLAPGSGSMTSLPTGDPQSITTSSNPQASDGGADKGQPLSAGSRTMARGAIVGGAIAGVLLLLVILSGCWWRRRRHHGRNGYFTGKGGAYSEGSVFQNATPATLATSSHTLADREIASEALSQAHGIFPSTITQIGVPSHSGYDGHGDEKQLDILRDTSLSPMAAATLDPLDDTLENEVGDLSAAHHGSGRRRQSMDGGLRLAGGPPGEELERLSMAESTGTLPPSYQLYR